MSLFKTKSKYSKHKIKVLASVMSTLIYWLSESLFSSSTLPYPWLSNKLITNYTSSKSSWYWGFLEIPTKRSCELNEFLKMIPNIFPIISTLFLLKISLKLSLLLNIYEIIIMIMEYFTARWIILTPIYKIYLTVSS